MRRCRGHNLDHTKCQGSQQMCLLMGGELFYQTLYLVKCTFCHVLLLTKDNVYCSIRSTLPSALPIMHIGGQTPGMSRALLRVGFRVEPAVSQPAPPQTRTCAMNAYGSSGARVSAPLWRITFATLQAPQMWWTILGGGKTYVCSSFSNFAQPIGLLLLRRLSQYRHAFSA
jgi:hypothetical protein